MAIKFKQVAFKDPHAGGLALLDDGTPVWVTVQDRAGGGHVLTLEAVEIEDTRPKPEPPAYDPPKGPIAPRRM